ncbi:MAG: CsgG/HfaB family protein [Gammaproteobacteria bacterium]|nr:CsgG/HfaB family protein [Gammaproteobacteria bacterium]
MKTRNLLNNLVLIALVGILASACTTVSSSSEIAGDLEGNAVYQGNKARIVVGRFKCKASNCSNRAANGIGDMLSTSLSNVENLIVLANQDEVKELAQEINMANSGYVEKGSGPQAGLMEGADIMVIGSITAFEPDAGAGGGSVGRITTGLLGDVGISRKVAQLNMDVKLVDIRLRRILVSIPIRVKSSNWGGSVAASHYVRGVSLGGELGMYANSPMEDAIRAAIAGAVEKVGKKIPPSYYRYKGQGQYQQDYRR